MITSLVLSAILAISLSLNNASTTAPLNQHTPPAENAKGINPVQHSE